MEELGWERNMFNINHHQQKTQESIIFGSQNNIFLNPIQDLTKTGSNPITTTADGQFGSHHSDSASQYWYQTLASVNCLHEGTSVIPQTPLEWPDCLRHISSDDSETKEIDDGIASQNSPEKNPNSNSGYYEPNRRRSKRSRSDLIRPISPTINFRQSTSESDETDSEVIAQMKEMIYRAAAFRPVSFADEDPVEKRRRKNVRISNDPQTVAARKRRERVSERIRVLQKLVPGGNKMDTASMLDEAANYLKFLMSQVKALEQFGQKLDYVSCGTTTNAYGTTQNIQIFNDNVTLGVPLPMQTHILQPHQQIYPTLPSS